MYKRLIYLVAFVLLLCVTGSASAVLPAGWTSLDIGTTGGSASHSGDTWTITADGADIWDASDEFHYVYQTATGDCEIIVRVQSLENTHVWAKAGVMVRESLDVNSKFVDLMMTPPDGARCVQFIWRPDTGANCGDILHTDTPSWPYDVPTPEWVKLVRAGNTFMAYHSDDGVSWDEIGSTTVAMSLDVFVGLAVTSHEPGQFTTAVIDNVSIILCNFVSGPDPEHGARDVLPDANLTWTAGDNVAWNQVYLGTDPNALELVATIASGDETYQHNGSFILHLFAKIGRKLVFWYAHISWYLLDRVAHTRGRPCLYMYGFSADPVGATRLLSRWQPLKFWRFLSVSGDLFLSAFHGEF